MAKVRTERKSRKGVSEGLDGQAEVHAASLCTSVSCLVLEREMIILSVVLKEKSGLIGH